MVARAVGGQARPSERRIHPAAPAPPTYATRAPSTSMLPITPIPRIEPRFKPPWCFYAVKTLDASLTAALPRSIEPKRSKLPRNAG